MRPNRLIVQSYVTRGAQIWACSRVMLSGVFLLAGESPFKLGPVVIAAMILLSVVIALLETHRRHERALLGNLGIATPVTAGLFLVPATLGELALRLVSAAFQ